MGSFFRQVDNSEVDFLLTRRRQRMITESFLIKKLVIAVGQE
ncbi:hypothetical protein CLU81_0485 [Flavobacterium sp. 9]|nr:hypothetical protein CLU81_0485 [Flavobacterium sp. 9]